MKQYKKIIKWMLGSITIALFAAFIFPSFVSAEFHELNIKIEEQKSSYLSGWIPFSETDYEIRNFEAVVIDRASRTYLWAEALDDWTLEKRSGVRGISFKLDLEGGRFGGRVDFSLEGFDALGRKVAVGQIPLFFDEGGLDSVQFEKRKVYYDKSSESVSVSVVTSEVESSEARLHILLKEDGITGQALHDLILAPKKESRDGRFVFDVKDLKVFPGKYFILMRLEDSKKIPLTTWSVEPLVVDGFIMKIYGVSPLASNNLPEDLNILPLRIEGYVPPKDTSQMVVEVVQKDFQKKELKQQSFELELLFDEHQKFFFEEDLLLDSYAEIVQVEILVVPPFQDVKSLKKKMIYRRPLSEDRRSSVSSDLGKISNVSQSEKEIEIVSQEQGDKELKMIIILLGALVLILLGLVFRKSNKALKGIILILGLSASTAFGAEIGGYSGSENTLVNPDPEIILNPSPSGAIGFSHLMVKGSLDNADPIGQIIFADPIYDFEGGEVSYRLNGSSGGYTKIGSQVDAEDIYLFQNSIVNPEWNSFIFSVDMTSYTALPQGVYDVRVQLFFNDGVSSDTITIYQDEYFVIDKTAPVLSITHSGIGKSVDYTFTCSNENHGKCITDSREALIRIQGNFCDGQGVGIEADNLKLCDTDLGKRTFEVCDSGGNCSLLPLIGTDFFEYDAFSPTLKNDIELRRGQGNSVVGSGFIPSATLKTQDEFSLDLREDEDREINLADYPGVPAAGPNSDPDMSGTRGYDPVSDSLQCREYNEDVNGNLVPGNIVNCSTDHLKSPFFFGKEPDDVSSSNIVRQRTISCTNGIGHRGAWDRSITADNSYLYRCHQAPETQPLAGGDCPLGYQIVTPPINGRGVISQVAMDGGDGSFAVLYGENPVNNQRVHVAAEEDQVDDTERAHTHEEFGYWVLFADNSVDIKDKDGVVIGESAKVGGVSTSPTTVSLRNTYTNPVITTVYNLPTKNDRPAGTRISSIGASSFDVSLQNPGNIPGNLPTNGDVYYVVLEAGNYLLGDDIAPIPLEAGKTSVANFNKKGDWNASKMVSLSPVNSYSNPVVFGQVMTSNNVDFQAFWSSNGSRTSRPDSSNIYIGRHTGESSPSSLLAEDLGYIIIEAGKGAWDSINWEAGISSDNIRGVSDANLEDGFTIPYDDPAPAICRKTCGDDYIVNSSGLCERVSQCDPVLVEKVLNNPAAWINQSGATKPNQNVVFETGVYDPINSVEACGWGCAEGYVEDPDHPGQCKETCVVSVVEHALNYTGNEVTLTAPSEASSIEIELWGGAGGTDCGYTGGTGGYTRSIFPITSPGQSFRVLVGGGGNFDATPSGERVGFGGQGGEYSSSFLQDNPGGGGLTGIFLNDLNVSHSSQSRAVAIAGGGGGGACYSPPGGGYGSATAYGGPGNNPVYSGGQGSIMSGLDAPIPSTDANDAKGGGAGGYEGGSRTNSGDSHNGVTAFYGRGGTGYVHPDTCSGFTDISYSAYGSITPQGTGSSGYSGAAGSPDFGNNSFGVGEAGRAVVRFKTCGCGDYTSTHIIGEQRPYVPIGTQPDDIPDLDVWLDAMDYDGDDDYTNQPEDESRFITDWIDKSGNGNNYDLYYSGSIGPTYEEFGINGYGVVEITDDGYDAPPGAAMPSDGDFTVYYVARKSSSDSNGRILDGSSSNWLFGFWEDNRKSIYFNGNPSEYASGNATNSETTAAHLNGVIRESSGRLQFRDEDGSIKTWNSSNNPSGIRWDINRGYARNSQSSDFQIGELLIYDRSLSDAERDTIEDYLKNKWGL